MRGIALILTALLASALAFQPRIFGEKFELTSRDQRLITDAIAGAINDLSQSIREAGLDPLDIPYASDEYTFPAEGILEARAYVKDVHSTGLSNIRINNLNFGIITTRLTFDISLPRIDTSFSEVVAEALVFNKYDLRGSASGSVVVLNPRINGSVRVNVGIISGISIRELNLNFTLGDIDSNLLVTIFGRDISEEVNNFVGQSIPKFLEDNRNEINRILEDIVLRIIEEIL